MYTIYILQCSDHSLYTGITADLPRRMRQHMGMQSGGAKYTRSHPPAALLQLWETDTHAAAAKFEFAFKQLSRQQKIMLLQSPAQWECFFPSLCNYTFTPKQPLSLFSYCKK